MSERTSPAAPFFADKEEAEAKVYDQVCREVENWNSESAKPRGMTLYSLPAAFAEIEAMAEEGELSEAAIERLASLEGTLAEKVQSCLCVARNFAARYDARIGEASRLQDLAESDRKSELGIYAYVEKVLRQLKVDKIETDLFKVSFAKNPPKVVVKDDLDIETLPDEWLRVVPEHKELDKKKVLAASKDCPLPFGVEVQQTDRMVIR